MPNSPRHLSWENFKRVILYPGQRRMHTIRGKPQIDIVAPDGSKRLMLRIPLPEEATIPKKLTSLASIALKPVKSGKKFRLEISTDSPALLREFYSFATNVADLVQLEGVSPFKALDQELAALKALLARSPLLEKRREIGLLGELWYLDALLALSQDSAFTAWLGPTGELHDFRLGNIEIEVKTTLKTQRIHIVGSAQQLEPSMGCDLFILSLQLGPAGKSKGISLKSVITSLRSKIQKEETLESLNRFLESLGYKDSDARHYSTSYQFRTPPVVIPVDDSCPRITRQHIENSLGPLAERIDSLQYEVNFEGLGFARGSKEFSDITGLTLEK